MKTQVSKVTSELLHTAIERALDFLSNQQLRNGRFNIDCMTEDVRYPDVFPDESPFATSHVVYSLGYSHSEKAKVMIEKALRFFQNEMEWPGIWRYWVKGHPKHSYVPPDLDDIACISFLLERHGVQFPDNKSVLFLNRNREGLFYTWLVARVIPTFNLAYWWTTLRDLNAARLYFYWKRTGARRTDIDSVVNANVLLYLGQSKATEPVIDYLIQVVQQQKEATSDKWYQDSSAFWYALSRNYAAGVSALDVVREQILARITSSAQLNGCIGENDLTTALACCTLMDFDCSSALLDAGVAHLLFTQQEGGGWPRFPFYYGGRPRMYRWGSSELTTGFCLEALERYHARSLV